MKTKLAAYSPTGGGGSRHGSPDQLPRRGRQLAVYVNVFIFIGFFLKKTNENEARGSQSHRGKRGAALQTRSADSMSASARYTRKCNDFHFDFSLGNR